MDAKKRGCSRLERWLWRWLTDNIYCELNMNKKYATIHYPAELEILLEMEVASNIGAWNRGGRIGKKPNKTSIAVNMIKGLEKPEKGFLVTCCNECPGKMYHHIDRVLKCISTKRTIKDPDIMPGFCQRETLEKENVGSG